MALLNKLRWALLSPGDKVLVAVSGGPDSLSLLHVLWTHQKARQLGGVEAAHLDHGLRGEESAAEAAWVAAWCAERGIACHPGRGDAAAWAREHRQSTQEAARAVRYAFLERTAAAIGANKIATGHTQSDQAETVLGNVLRGTGLDGLRGIPERRGLLVRPLLDVTRTEVEAYCAANNLLPRRDPSNFASGHYTRNRIRLELLPELRRDYNPGVDKALLRLSEIAARDSDYLTMQAQTALAGITRSSNVFSTELERAKLAALHPALLRHVVRLAITQMRGTGEGVTYEHLEAICRAVSLNSPTAFVLMLPSPPCTVRVAGQAMTLANADARAADFSVPLPIPGEADLGMIGWRVSSGWEDHTGAIRADADAVDIDTLTVRNRRPGDRIDPLGMGGRHKKVSDIFTDAKVPRPERDRIPMIADAHGIVWVAGHAQAERAKVTDGTTRILFLSAHCSQSRIGVCGRAAPDQGSR